MLIGLAAIGTLVSLAKSVAEALNALGNLLPQRSFFGGGNGAKAQFEKVRAELTLLYERLETLTDQLEKSELLVRITEAWLQVERRLRLPATINSLSADEAGRMHNELRDFLHSSRNDYFSGAFFHTDFKPFPDIENDLNAFRNNLTQIENTVNTIPSQSTSVLKGQWVLITGQMNSLRTSADKVSGTASTVHDRLISELKEAARQRRA